MKLINIIIIIFFVLLLIYLVSINYNEKTYVDYKKNESAEFIKEFINGYWTSDDDFAKLSEIDEMILNIDSNSMRGFLVIIVDNNIIINNDFDLLLFHNKCNEIEFISDSIDFIWSEKKFKISTSINKGSIQLYYDDVLYASLYKDNKISSLLDN
jgi:hypothetical protein